MVLYITFEHNLTEEDRVRGTLLTAHMPSGEEIALDWDESDWSYDGNCTTGRCKGVYLDDEYANGRLAALEGVESFELAIDAADEDADLEPPQLLQILAEDGGETMEWGVTRSGTVRGVNRT